MDYPERFWLRVDKTDKCWLWTGPPRPDGYGQTWDGERVWLSHRYAWFLVNGPVPKGLELDHLCRVRACVNPAHLEPVTHRENILRGTAPAALHAKKTHCPKGHPYSPENTYRRKSGRQEGARVCRTCTLARMERYRRAS